MTRIFVRFFGYNLLLSSDFNLTVFLRFFKTVERKKYITRKVSTVYSVQVAMNLKILMSFQLFIQRLPSIHTVRYLLSKANLFLALFLESLRLNKCAFSFKNPALGPVSRKVMVTFWAWKAVLSSPCLYSRSKFQSFWKWYNEIHHQITKQNWPVCELGTVLIFNKFWF